jgi:sulfate adenylyltransferase subunit 2
VPLYFAAERPVVERDGMLIMVDDDRMPLRPGEEPSRKRWCASARSAATRSPAPSRARRHAARIIQEMLLTTTSERQGRVIDHDQSASMEKKKQEGYF